VKSRFDGAEWMSVLWSLALGMILHGRSTVEVEWKIQEGAFVPVRYQHCHPGQFAFLDSGEMAFAPHSGLSVVTALEPVHPLRFISVRGPALYNNPWGWSAVAFLAPFYHFKKRALVAELRNGEKNGSPILHASIPTGAGELPALVDDLKTQLEALEDDDALITSHGEMLNIHHRMAGGLGGGGSVFEASVSRIDSYFTRRLLGAELSSTVTDRGARSLGEVHERTVRKKVVPYGSLLVEPVQNHVDAYVISNYGVSAPRPRFYIDLEDSIDTAEAAELLKIAKAIGLRVAVEQAQEWLGIRPVSEGEPILPAGGLGISAKGELTTAEDETPSPAAPAPKVVVADPENVPEVPDEEEEEDSEGEESGKTPFSSTPQSHFEALGTNCLMLRLKDEIKAMIAEVSSQIAEEDLAEGGRVFDSHLTIRYGLTDEVTPEDVRRYMSGSYPVIVETRGWGIFSSDETPHDVLYLSTYPGDVDEIYREAMQIPGPASEREFVPHVTVAYLKKGTAQKYAETLDSPWVFQVVWDLTYCHGGGMETTIPLLGRYVELEEAEARFQSSRRTLSTLRDLLPEDDFRTLGLDPGPRGEAFRQSERDYSKATQKRITAISDKLSEELVKETLPQLREALKFLRYKVDLNCSPTQSLPIDARGWVNLPQSDFEAPALNLIFGAWLLGAGKTALDLAFVSGKDTANFSEADDLLEGLGDEFRQAADWMASRGVMTKDAIETLALAIATEHSLDAAEVSRTLRDHYLALAGNVSLAGVKHIQGMVEEAVKAGTTASAFLDQIDNLTEAGLLPGRTTAYWRTVFRTEVANAYNQQQAQYESSPEYKKHLWGYEYYNPADARSRPSHAAMNGKQMSVETADKVGRPPYAYNCRCSLFAIMSVDPSRSPYREDRNSLTLGLGLERFCDGEHDCPPD
jgi:SPP1 gp7 family putative phage head morphogenesis protein